MISDSHYIEKRSEDLIDKSFLGIVEDANDPAKEGKCRIRVFGIHGEEVPTKSLPWAYPKGKSLYFGEEGKAGAISIPKEGSTVSVKFDNGNIYSPEYFSIQELADDIKSELQKDSEYHGSHFLLFDGDEELKIWFTKEKGITMQLKGSRVNIGQDKAITIEHDQTQSIIELKGSEINITANNANTVISDRLFSLKNKFKDAENFDDSFKLDRYTGKLLFRREMNTNKSTETTTMIMKGNCTKIKNNIKKF